MKRALILLTDRKQLRHVDRAVDSCKGDIDEYVLVELTAAIRLSESEVAGIEAKGLRYLEFDEIEMENSHEELSKTTTQLINITLERAMQDQEIVQCSTYSGVSLIETQDNDIYTYGYRILIALAERTLSVIKSERPDKIITFGTSRSVFKYPERPDIERLYDREIIHGYLIESVARALNLEYQIVPSLSKLRAVLKLRARALVLRAYKFYVLIMRVLRDQRYRKLALNPEPVMKPRVCVLIRGESEYWTIRPVIELLRSTETMDVVLLQDDIIKDPSARSVLEKANEKFIPIHAFLTVWEYVKLFMRSIGMSWQFDRKLVRVQFENAAQTSDPSDSLHAQILRGDSAFAREVLRSMSKRFSEELIFVEELERFIERYKPNIFVTMSMVDNWGPLFCETGKRHGIKTLALQNAALSFLSLPTMIFAHKFAVASQKQLDGLVRLGADPELIEVTGHPQYDPYLKERRDPKPIRDSLNITPEQKFLLLTTQPTRHEENIEFIEAALEAVASMSNVKTIIKLHPREQPAEYGALADQIEAQNHCAKIVHHRDVVELISAADLMISRFSTTIQSALMIGTPVVAYVSSSYRDYDTDYLASPAVIKATDLEMFKKTILEHLSGNQELYNEFMKNRAEYLEQTVGVADGRASERIVSLIEELLGERIRITHGNE